MKQQNDNDFNLWITFIYMLRIKLKQNINILLSKHEKICLEFMLFIFYLFTVYNKHIQLKVYRKKTLSVKENAKENEEGPKAFIDYSSNI